MRKRIISHTSEDDSAPGVHWLDLEALAEVEITSEDRAHPVELALAPSSGSGWRAAEPGQQTLRILFDEPQKLSRIRLSFVEEAFARTQQFVLRWRTNGADPFQEIVRQQYNFSPPGTTKELEDYNVELENVAAVELTITPDISGQPAVASLAHLQLGAA